MSQRLFDLIKESFKTRVSENTFKTWFEPMKFLRAEGNIFLIQVPESVFVQVLTRTYRQIIEASLREIGQPDIKFEYEVENRDVPEQS